MRCYICDYSHDTPSDYYSGLVIDHKYRSLMPLTDGSFICQICYDEGFEDNYQDEDGEEPVIEVDWDKEI